MGWRAASWRKSSRPPANPRVAGKGKAAGTHAGGGDEHANVDTIAERAIADEHGIDRARRQPRDLLLLITLKS